MVAMLPDSSQDLWRLCHNFGRVRWIVPALLPHLVIDKTSIVSPNIGLNQPLQVSQQNYLPRGLPRLKSRGLAFMVAEPSRLPIWARLFLHAGSIWYHI